MSHGDDLNEFSDRELEIWKKVIDVQMHFNDLELRVRNYAILSLGAIITVSGYTLKDGNHVPISGFNVPFASITLFCGAIIWLCFWFMDRHWYHRLLLGSVQHGIKIEKKYKECAPSICLSETIKEESPNDFLGLVWRSQHRLNLFYWTIAVCLLFFSFSLVNWMFAIVLLIFAITMTIIILISTLEFATPPSP